MKSEIRICKECKYYKEFYIDSGAAFKPYNLGVCKLRKQCRNNLLLYDSRHTCERWEGTRKDLTEEQTADIGARLKEIHIALRAISVYLRSLSER